LKRVSAFFINEETGIKLTMFLLCHFCLLRGESSRRIELPDLFALDLGDEGKFMSYLI
jgi:hypothetical protein